MAGIRPGATYIHGVRWNLRWLHRPVSALIAVWFALVLVEPAALHSCPVHGDHGAPAATLAGATHSSDGPADLEHADHHATSAGDHAPDESHSGCTCPDDCATAAAGMVVPDAHIIATAVVIPTTTAIVDPAVSRPAHVRIAFELPFANGPPVLPRPA